MDPDWQRNIRTQKLYHWVVEYCPSLYNNHISLSYSTPVFSANVFGHFLRWYYFSQNINKTKNFWRLTYIGIYNTRKTLWIPSAPLPLIPIFCKELKIVVRENKYLHFFSFVPKLNLVQFFKEFSRCLGFSFQQMWPS